MSDRMKLLPSSAKDLPTSTPASCRLSIAWLLFLGFAVTPLGLAFFIVRTMLIDFEGSTYTDCGVLNVLPSVSAIARDNLIGWKLVTWILLPFRLLIAYLYCRYYRHVFTRGCCRLGWLSLPLFVYESLSTVAMACWVHISGDTLLHKVSVMSIWCSSFGYIAISFMCFKQHQRFDLEPHQQLSFMLKRRICIIYCVATLFMWCLYLLHTNLCLPLAYSFFALCEYIVSWSLMGYLWTSVLDFYPLYLCRSAQLGFYLLHIIN